MRPFPGPGGRIPVSAEGGGRAVWAHNGREIFYLGPDGSWMVASVRTDPEFAVLSRNRFASAEGFVSITTTQHYDLAADDERLLALRAGGGPGAQVRDVVVLGFFEELKRLVPN